MKKNDTDLMIDFTFKAPTYVGCYILGTDYYIQFNFTHKPNWFHRTMMRLFFGWKWVNL